MVSRRSPARSNEPASRRSVACTQRIGRSRPEAPATTSGTARRNVGRPSASWSVTPGVTSATRAAYARTGRRNVRTRTGNPTIRHPRCTARPQRMGPMSNDIVHWVDGAELPGRPDGWADVTNPATGQVTGRVALASEADAQQVIAAAAACRPGVGHHLARPAYAGDVRLPRAAQQPQGRARRDHHRRARQGALRRDRRDLARPRGRRVRLRHLPPAQGRPQRGGVHRRRRALQARAARRRRDHQPLQLPGDGADVVLPHRHRRRQHRRAQAQREGPERRQLDRRALDRRPVSPTASSTCCTATRPPSTRCSPAPTCSRSASSARPRSRSTSTRPRAATASASRPSAARRTTWSCCPTPTSTWPPTRPSTPATAAPASAAWRSACSSRSTRSATSSSPGSPTAPAPC